MEIERCENKGITIFWNLFDVSMGLLGKSIIEIKVKSNCVGFII